MKDQNGLYYYPNPADTKTRVYVRQGAGGIEFRLWRSDREDVWEKHDWLPYDVVLAAAEVYKTRGNASDPLELYDINVADALIKDDQRPRR